MLADWRAVMGLLNSRQKRPHPSLQAVALVSDLGDKLRAAFDVLA